MLLKDLKRSKKLGYSGRLPPKPIPMCNVISTENLFDLLPQTRLLDVAPQHQRVWPCVQNSRQIDSNSPRPDTLEKPAKETWTSTGCKWVCRQFPKLDCHFERETHVIRNLCEHVVRIRTKEKSLQSTQLTRKSLSQTFSRTRVQRHIWKTSNTFRDQSLPYLRTIDDKKELSWARSHQRLEVKISDGIVPYRWAYIRPNHGSEHRLVSTALC